MLADCPECGLPATVTDHGRAAGTDGPVKVVKLHCLMSHWFMGPADALLREPSPVKRDRHVGAGPAER